MFANTQAVSVWGGEDGSFNDVSGVSDIAEYGKVFISLKPKDQSYLTSLTKQEIVKELKKYVVASVEPKLVDP